MKINGKCLVCNADGEWEAWVDTDDGEIHFSIDCEQCGCSVTPPPIDISKSVAVCLEMLHKMREPEPRKVKK